MKHSNGRDSTLPVGVLERGEQFFSIWLTEERKKSKDVLHMVQVVFCCFFAEVNLSRNK